MEALVDRLVNIVLSKENEDLTRKELVEKFTKVLKPEIRDIKKHVRSITINDCIKSITDIKTLI